MRHRASIFALLLSLGCNRYEVVSGDPSIPPPPECFSRTPTATPMRPAGAWRDAALAGRTVDEYDRPIRGALILLLPDSARAVTNDSGYFAFPTLPPGEHRLLARALGYGSLQTTVSLPGTDGSGLRIRLPVRYVDGPCSAVVIRRKQWWKWW